MELVHVSSYEIPSFRLWPFSTASFLWFLHAPASDVHLLLSAFFLALVTSPFLLPSFFAWLNVAGSPSLSILQLFCRSLPVANGRLESMTIRNAQIRNEPFSLPQRPFGALSRLQAFPSCLCLRRCSIVLKLAQGTQVEIVKTPKRPLTSGSHSGYAWAMKIFKWF